MQGGGNLARLLAHVAALAAEVTACGGELPTPAENSPPAARALSTKEAAARLGVTPYTVNEWCRLGLLGFRQDTPGGRRHFSEGDLAAYEAAHHAAPVAQPLADSYSPGHGNHNGGGIPQAPALARVDASAARRGARGNEQHSSAMGTRRARGKPARANRPFSPGAGAWCPKKPEG